MQKRSAWVITWTWKSETRRPDKLIVHILPPEWGVESVVAYMKPLYMNCELFPLSERFDFFSRKAWRGRIRCEGQRILVGEDPILFASLVSDFSTQRDESGVQFVRWTPPPGVRRSSRGERLIFNHGPPTEKVFKIHTDGEVTLQPSRIASCKRS